MKFSVVSRAWLLLSHLALVRADIVSCNQWFAQCENKTVICGEGSDCRIYCGNQGCVHSAIHCPDGYECTIYCRGYRACYQAGINGGNASSLSVISEDNNGNRQIEGTTIYCGIASCNVTCSKEFQVCLIPSNNLCTAYKFIIC